MALRVAPRSRSKRHKVTLAEYERMAEAGVFEPDARIELIRGEIIDMTPPGPDHETSVTRLTLLFVEQCHRRAVVWPQGNGISIPQSESRPQPDITILKWRDDLYKWKRAGVEDVLLIVEVADSTLKFDRGTKLRLYAEAGIPEYWVVNLVDGVVEVYTGPAVGTYQTVRIAHRGEMLPLPGGFGGTIAAGEMLDADLPGDAE